jgi:glycosyltransferase involved in cell wall biosynthesis
MPYKLLEVELSGTIPAINVASNETGLGLIARWHGRLVGFVMLPVKFGGPIPSQALNNIFDEFAHRVLALRLEIDLTRTSPTKDLRLPSLSIVICTKDRAQRLNRLLASLQAPCQRSEFPHTEIVVVDNASVDPSTKDVARNFANVRYVFEPKAGLNFARNAGLRNVSGDLVAYLDDDVVVDRHWLIGLAAAWRSCPDAGGFTGLVLPFRLETEAQIYFESHGGFGRGFCRKEFNATRFDDPLYPVGAGELGAGCNMAFDRQLLLKIGGFDEALDTGAPLPGGGDLDIFYRVLRSDRMMVYEPQYAVYHEHRETLRQLRRQYWSWGLGLMTYIVKCRRTDIALHDKHVAMVRWWFLDQIKTLLKSARRIELRGVEFRIAELWGGICGLAGEYDRSQARIRIIKERQMDG